MIIRIVAVGSELLTPFGQETDSLYLTGRLNDLGFQVATKTVVGDDLESLKKTLRQALENSELVLVSGGLGPTDDDRTREAAAEVLGRRLFANAGLLQAIEERFRRRDRVMPSSNAKQAEVIEGAEILANPAGTAPGLWIEDDGKTLVLLPGPPSEIQAVCEAHVWPRLSRGRRPILVRKTLKTTGLTESELEVLISGLYPHAPDLELTVLATPGQIELHLTGLSDESGDSSSRVDALAARLRERLGDRIFSEDGSELEEVVGSRLTARTNTVAVAESCTGGLLSGRLTAVPGSSAYFLEGFVVYGNRAKAERIGVDEALIARFGAVSAEVAESMAAGARRVTGADHGLAVTGIAGPGGSSPDKPLGLVFTALSNVRGTGVERNLFFGDRGCVRRQATQKALDMLRKHLDDERGS